jgi:hypothetical protein
LEDILAHTKARSQAVEFVTVLRCPPYRLQAWMFNRGDDERKKEQERDTDARRQREQFLLEHGASGLGFSSTIHTKRVAHIEDQYIVLIGGFRSRDDAHNALNGIHKLPPPDKEFCNVLFDSQRDSQHAYYINPFDSAMVIHNPTVPVEKPKLTQDDVNKRAIQLAEIVEMNEHNPLSPLKYENKWTLVVKEYKLHVKMDDAKKRETAYDFLGKQAEALATLLRNPAFGLDAYVIHTRVASLVTVGIFDSPQDPRMASTQVTLSKLSLRDQTGHIKEDLMSQPMPFQIQPLPNRDWLNSTRSWIDKLRAGN